LLEREKDAVTDVPPERWQHANVFHPDGSLLGRTPATQGGFLGSVYDFDADFFGISPREAESVDPQHRLLLELAYEAIERAGYPLGILSKEPTGVFIGLSSYDLYHDAGAFGWETYTATGVSPAMASNRISYAFDLHGPSLTVDTACSAALTALDLAWRSLASGQCEQALVGAVNLLLDPAMFLAFSRLGMLSPSNRCRAFSAAADGFVRGEGGVMMLVKPMSKVQRTDPVEAVVLATGLNQDGRSEGITVPNQQAQEALLRALYADPALLERVFAIETHGTGTPVGDPIEARAISRALGLGPVETGRTVWLGSVKTNIGHLEGAAGGAGLLKAVLCLGRGKFPANLHFDTSPPGLDLCALGLGVPARMLDMPEQAVIGVSSFGFGGSSGHAVLAPPPPRPPNRAQVARQVLLPLSARSPGALSERVRQIQTCLETPDAPALEDLAYSLSCRGTHHRHRVAFVGGTAEQLSTAMGLWLEDDAHPVRPTSGMPVFVFSGQGPQWWGMGRELLADQPVFRRVLERCDQLLQDLGGRSVVELLSAAEAESLLAETEFAQPALFSVQVGLVELWKSWGVRPAAVVGHSVGEVAAAYAAGVLTLEQAVRVIYHRALTMQHGSARGGMLSVQAPLETLRSLLEPWSGSLEIGAVNGPHEVSVSGLEEAVEALADRLEEQGIPCRRIPVQYAFHSFLVDPVREPLLLRLSELRPGAAEVPVYSTVSGGRLQGQEMDAGYWWRNVRQTVLFAEAVGQLMDLGHRLFLEVGPHPVLASSLLDVADARRQTLTTVASLHRGHDQNECVLVALGRLWCSGLEVDWEAISPQGELLKLPAYPWQRKTFRSVWRDRRRGLFASRPYPLLGVRQDHALPTWRGLADGRPLGAGHLLELVLEAASSLPSWTGAMRLRNVHLPSVEQDALSYETWLDEVSGRVSVSAMNGQGWSELLSGEVGRYEGPAPGPPVLPSRLQELSCGYFAGAVRRWGYGLEFPVLRCASTGQTLLIEMEWPQEESQVCHPGALWAALLSGLAGREPSVLAPPRQALLAGIDELHFLAVPRERVCVLCRVESESPQPTSSWGGGESWSTHISVFDETRLYLEVRGARWNLAPSTLASAPVDEMLLGLEWIHLPRSTAGKGDGQTFSARRVGPGAELLADVLVDGDGSLIFVAGAVDPVEQMEGLLQLVTGGEVEQRSPRWVLVTRGAQGLAGEPVCLQQAPLLGFWRTLQVEHPRFRPLMIDLPSQPGLDDLATLAACLDSAESELAVRNGQALAPRWKSRSLTELSPQAPEPLRWPTPATCLISGGLTGLGAALARWLARRGVSHLVLLGRRGLETPGAASLVAELEELGATVRVEARDVAELEDLPLSGLPSLHAVFHAANQMEDAIVSHLDRGKLERVWRAKAQGAWKLHQLSLDHPIEHFVLFSSISAVLGAPGQANYAAANAYLDGLAHNRRSTGLPALVVNWGPIADVGYLPRHPEVLAALGDQGYEPLPCSSCLQVLEYLMACRSGPLAVVKADWDRLERGPRLSILRQERALAEPGEQEREGVLAFLQDRAERILRLPGDPALVERPLREMGLDSVMAVEFRNAIESRFAVPLPVVSILSGPSLSQLAETVSDLLATNRRIDSQPLSYLSDEEVSQLLAQLEDSDSAESRPASGG
jgi:acyl transferase domain-containing protein